MAAWPEDCIVTEAPFPSAGARAATGPCITRHTPVAASGDTFGQPTRAHGAGPAAHRLAAVLLPLLLYAPAAPAAEPAAVTIYRCTDSRGQLAALRDSPCLAGERQEVLQMQRPQDPPLRPAPPPAAAATPPAPVREVRVVTVQPPQPMYACTTPEGERYTSEDGEGHPRWVPFWTLGHGYPGSRPHWPRPSGPRPPDAGPGPGMSPGGPRPGMLPTRPGHVVVPAGGTWVRDTCVRLSQQEVCTQLSDRRYEILRLYHAAMPSQRQALDREQRQIDARMGNDCPGY